MFGRSIYFPVFYCLGYFKDMSTDFSEEQVSVERDWYLNEEKDIIMYDTRDQHWRDVAKEGDDKKKIRSLRWELYVKDNTDLIKRDFPVSVTHPKRGNIVWTCVNDNTIKEKEDYKDTGLHGFDYKLFEEKQDGGLERDYIGILILSI